MRNRPARLIFGSLFVVFCSWTSLVAQAPDEVDARADASAIAKRLGDKDSSVRQRAAEALATLAAVDQKKMIEGYRLQEKDKNVRLALDWALYRIGKSNLIYDIVHQLDSGRHDQAVGYLAQLDSPTLLNSLLKKEDNAPRIRAGLMEALAKIGDTESLDLIKPYRDSLEPRVAAAAELATDEIEKRLAQVDSPVPGRPRTVSNVEKP